MTSDDIGMLAVGSAGVVVGLIALAWPKPVNDLHVALIRLGPFQPTKMPGLLTTRVIGTWFLIIGLILAVPVIISRN